MQFQKDWSKCVRARELFVKKYVFTCFTPLNELENASGRDYTRNPYKVYPSEPQVPARARNKKNKNNIF